MTCNVLIESEVGAAFVKDICVYFSLTRKVVVVVAVYHVNIVAIGYGILAFGNRLRSTHCRLN